MTHNEKLQFYRTELSTQAPEFKANSEIYLSEIEQIISGIESGFSFLIELGKIPNKELLDTIEKFYDLKVGYEKYSN